MAFIPSSPVFQSFVPFGPHSSVAARPRCLSLTTGLPFRWSMVQSPDPTSSSAQTSTSTTPPFSQSAPSPTSNSAEEYTSPVDVDVLVDRAKEIASDLTERPGYYSKILAYGAGGIVVITILRAIVAAIDSLPVLPATLELIGLGYSAWFIWRYVLFRESRAELLEEIDEFLGRTRPGAKK